MVLRVPGRVKAHRRKGPRVDSLLLIFDIPQLWTSNAACKHLEQV